MIDRTGPLEGCNEIHELVPVQLSVTINVARINDEIGAGVMKSQKSFMKKPLRDGISVDNMQESLTSMTWDA